MISGSRDRHRNSLRQLSRQPSAGRMPATAVSVLVLSLASTGVTQAAGLTARGNEPGWRIEISDKNIVYHGQDGETFTIEPLPQSVTTNGADTFSAKVGDR